MSAGGEVLVENWESLDLTNDERERLGRISALAALRRNGGSWTNVQRLVAKHEAWAIPLLRGCRLSTIPGSQVRDVHRAFDSYYSTASTTLDELRGVLRRTDLPTGDQEVVFVLLHLEREMARLLEVS